MAVQQVKNAHVCPSCDAEHIESIHFEYTDSGAVAHCVCRQCWAEWRDVYVLTIRHLDAEGDAHECA